MGPGAVERAFPSKGRSTVPSLPCFSKGISAARSRCWWFSGQTSLLDLRAALKGAKVTGSVSNDLQRSLALDAACKWHSQVPTKWKIIV